MSRAARWLAYTAVGAAGLVGGLAAFSRLSASGAQRRVPPDGRFIDLDGARLHYVDMGSGPTIVLIHGLTGQLRNFTYALTERLVADFRVIAIDRPGSGYSRFEGAGGRGLHAQAAILGRFIEALGLKRPLLVGHSLGGALALALATDRPDLVGGLALLSPLTQPVDETPRMFRPLTIPSRAKRRLVAHTLATPMSRLNRQRTLKSIFAPDAPPADFGERGGGLLGGRPSAFFAASTEITEGATDLNDIADAYARLKLPVGILFGRGDRVLAPDLHGAKTAGIIPDAQLSVIEGGHMIPITKPEETESFVRQQAARLHQATESHA